MGRKKVFGTCALCRRENMELMDSHIIPKATYRRAKTFNNSRFRSFYEPKKIFQDGEKKPMLCHECEEFFSQYETKFTNTFLDKYLKTDLQKRPEITEDINIYILTVAWRIIYDDLYVYQSYVGDIEKSIFEEYEYKLWRFLFQKFCKEHINMKVGARISKESKLEGSSIGVMIAKLEEYMRSKLPEDMSEVKNYIYTLDELGYSDAVSKLFSNMILGYSFYASTRMRYYILSMYNGLIITTVYCRKRSVLLTDNKETLKKASLSEDAIKEDIVKEINWQIGKIKDQYPKVKKELDESGLSEQIRKRYSK